MKVIDMACIIDDDPIHVFVTQSALKEQDSIKSVLVFTNGKEAYDSLKDLVEMKKTLPDVIFLDINMPIWDGWDFLDEFIKIPIDKKITIYVVSSSNNPEDMQRAKTYKEVDNFIIKPITMEKIKEDLLN